MFFDSTPNFLYPDFNVPGKYKLSKNLFRRIRVRDSFNAVYASSKQYTIISGETPDSIAYDKLGGSEWYWTILLLNNITDTTKQWPLSEDELEKLIEKKYGNLADKPRYWETSEIKDSESNIVLESGVIIETFMDTTEQNATNYYPQVRDPLGGAVTDVDIIDGGSGYSSYNGVSTIVTSGGGEGLTLNIVASSNGTITGATIGNAGLNYKAGDIVRVYGGNATVKINSATSIWTNWYFDYINSYNPVTTVRATAAENLNMVTNREYEYQLNELKREIYLPSLSVLPIMKSELEELLKYDTTYKITSQGYRESEEV